MVLEWREHEHEDVDRDMQADIMAQQDFRLVVYTSSGALVA